MPKNRYIVYVLEDTKSGNVTVEKVDRRNDEPFVKKKKTILEHLTKNRFTKKRVEEPINLKDPSEKVRKDLFKILEEWYQKEMYEKPEKFEYLSNDELYNEYMTNRGRVSEILTDKEIADQLKKRMRSNGFNYDGDDVISGGSNKRTRKNFIKKKDNSKN
jgi:hypothetical protein